MFEQIQKMLLNTQYTHFLQFIGHLQTNVTISVHLNGFYAVHIQKNEKLIHHLFLKKLGYTSFSSIFPTGLNKTCFISKE